MYKKSMRQALEEARAYTAVHEVKVSKGGRTLDISKDDLPVYKAKGWKLTEGTMKGGIVKYAGQSSSEYNKAKAAYKQFMSKPQPAKDAEDKVMPFIFDDELLDDLYVASKKNISDVRPIVKKRLNALGIKEEATETLDEFKRMSVFIPDPLKRAAAIRDISRFGGGTGFKIDVGSKTIKVDGKGKDLNKFATDLKNFYGAEIKAESVELEEGYEKAVLNALQKKGISGYFSKGTLFVDKGDEKAAKDAIDDEGSIFKAPKIIGEELQERFTIGDFKRLEADNRHDIAAKKLVDKFGTPEDKKEIDAINKRHNKTGYITGPDFKKRTQIVNKYFSKLMP